MFFRFKFAPKQRCSLSQLHLLPAFFSWRKIQLKVKKKGKKKEMEEKKERVRAKNGFCIALVSET